METYSLPSWSRRRCAGEIKSWIEEQGGAVSWGEALWTPPLLIFKTTTTVAVFLLPDKPKFEQLEGVNPDVARVLDLFEEQARGEVKVRPIGLQRPDWIRGMAQIGCVGVVFTWPAFYGLDP